jgi:amidophosphoribosyltransferase
MPEAGQREDSVDMKLAVLSGVVKDKRVVVVDDSLVRGTTSRRRVNALRRAGAREIHMRISCPPTRHPCFFGIDFPSEEELAAAGREPEDVARRIGADSLGYVSMEGLLGAVEQPADYCTGCFSGKYPMEVTGGLNKEILEVGERVTV